MGICAPNLFCPASNVSRDQMAIFIIRARYGATTVFTYPQTPYFAEVVQGQFGFAWIQRMKEDNITSGCAPTAYCPSNTVVRGDMAIFIMRGGFNDLLPATEPVVTSITPSTLTHGTTGTYTITGLNTTFQQGFTQLVFAPNAGITVNAITVTGPTTMNVSLTAAPTALLQPASIYEQTEPEETVLPNGLVIQ